MRSPETGGPEPDESTRGALNAAERVAADFASGAGTTEDAGLYRLLVDSVQDYAIFALDQEGYILSWNAGAERLKGYKPAEIIGRHFSTFYTPEDLADGKPPRELRIATATGKYEEEGWRVRKDGTHFWANVLITALWDSNGELAGFAKVTRDLTERKAAQERAIADARHIADVEAASRTKSEFLRAMSHELRTPINATLGYTELLELGVAGPTTEQQAEYLSRIRASQEYLLRLVNDLLNYSRIEAGQMEYDIHPVALRNLVDAVIPMLEPHAAAKGLRLGRDDCPDELVALADRIRTEQIVLNLLSNAVKFTPSGGTVRVRCESTEDFAVIRVSDSGPGIPLEHRDVIFQPFVQIGRTLTSGHEGSGLGLAISRDLARGMGGDLIFEDGALPGSTFVLTLPLA